MAFEQPWMLPEYHHAAFADSWSISELFTKETDAIASALERSLNGDFLSPDLMVESFLSTTPVPTPTISGGSENESTAAVKAPRAGPTPSGRVAKRRSRASKRALTTFINADPANFRQMVQQVTGAGFPAGQFATAQLLKPEPLRLRHVVPAMDSSSFFCDGAAAVMAATGTADGGAGTALDFDSFCSFPTLESWKVM